MDWVWAKLFQESTGCQSSYSTMLMLLAAEMRFGADKAAAIVLIVTPGHGWQLCFWMGVSCYWNWGTSNPWQGCGDAPLTAPERKDRLEEMGPPIGQYLQHECLSGLI